LKILDRFSKTSQIPDLLKTHPVAAKLFRVDGQTERDRQADMAELIVTFCNFADTSN